MGSGFLEMTPYIKLAEDEARGKNRKKKTKQLRNVGKSMAELQTMITLSCEIIKADTLRVLKPLRRCWRCSVEINLWTNEEVQTAKLLQHMESVWGSFFLKCTLMKG